MTQPFPDDELVSALLDDEVSPEERARLDADPRVHERLAELRQVRDLVATPVDPLDAATRDAIIAAALEALPDGATADGTESAAAGDATVTDLRARRRRPAAAWVSAAAAIVVAVLVGGVLIRSGTTSRDTTTSAAGPPTTAVVRGAAAAPEASDGAGDVGNQSADDATPSTTTPAASPDASVGSTEAGGSAAPLDLGQVRGPADLRDRAFRAAATVDVGSAAATPTVPGPTTGSGKTSGGAEAPTASTGIAVRCDVTAARRAPGLGAFHGGDPRLGAVSVVASATYQGRPAVVVAFAADGTSGVPRVLALDADTCEVLAVVDG